MRFFTTTTAFVLLLLIDLVNGRRLKAPMASRAVAEEAMNKKYTDEFIKQIVGGEDEVEENGKDEDDNEGIMDEILYEDDELRAIKSKLAIEREERNEHGGYDKETLDEIKKGDINNEEN